MLTAKVKIATGIVRWWMTRNNFAGWVGFNHIIYILQEPNMSAYSKEQFKKLMRHELTHLDDIVLEGIPSFAIEYVWQHLRYGYDKNYFEVKARTNENNPEFKSEYYVLDEAYAKYLE